MEILFSRHARRRMALYDISPDDVAKALEGITDRADLHERNEVTDHRLVGKYGYPVKVVYNREYGRVTVITAYPVKRELKRQ